MERIIKVEKTESQREESSKVKAEEGKGDDQMLSMLLKEVRLGSESNGEVSGIVSHQKKLQEGRSHRSAASVNAAEIYRELQKSSSSMQGETLQSRVKKALSGQVPVIDVICDEVRQLSPDLTGFVYQIIKPGKTTLDEITDLKERSRIALRAITDAALIAKQQNLKSCPAIGCILGCWLLGQHPGTMTLSLLSTVSNFLSIFIYINSSHNLLGIKGNSLTRVL